MPKSPSGATTVAPPADYMPESYGHMHSMALDCNNDTFIDETEMGLNGICPERIMIEDIVNGTHPDVESMVWGGHMRRQRRMAYFAEELQTDLEGEHPGMRKLSVEEKSRMERNRRRTLGDHEFFRSETFHKRHLQASGRQPVMSTEEALTRAISTNRRIETHVHVDSIRRRYSETAVTRPMMREPRSRRQVRNRMQNMDHSNSGYLPREEAKRVIRRTMPTSENLADTRRKPPRPADSRKDARQMDRTRGTAAVYRGREFEGTRSRVGVEVDRRSAEKMRDTRDRDNNGRVEREEMGGSEGQRERENYEAMANVRGRDDGCVDQREFTDFMGTRGTDGRIAPMTFNLRDTRDDGAEEHHCRAPMGGDAGGRMANTFGVRGRDRGLQSADGSKTYYRTSRRGLRECRAAPAMTGDGCLSREEATRSDTEVLAENSEECGVRRLLETLVHDPRRRSRQRRALRRERNLREKKRRALGESGFQEWFGKRQRRMLKRVDNERRQLREVEEDIEVRRQRRRQRRALSEKPTKDGEVKRDLQASSTTVAAGAMTADPWMTDSRYVAMPDRTERDSLDQERVDYFKNDAFFGSVDQGMLDEMAHTLGNDRHDWNQTRHEIKKIFDEQTCGPVTQRILSDPDPISGVRHEIGQHSRELMGAVAGSMNQRQKAIIMGAVQEPDMAAKAFDAAPDKAVMDALDAQTGGSIRTPFQACNTHGEKLGEIPSPFQAVINIQMPIMRRARARSIRVLSVAEEGLESKSPRQLAREQGAHRLLSIHPAGRRLLAMGNKKNAKQGQTPARRRKLQTKEEQLQFGGEELERRLTASCGLTSDEDLHQVLHGGEVSKCASELKIPPKSIEKLCADTAVKHQEVAAKKSQCMDRVLREVEVHPEDLEEVRQLSADLVELTEGEGHPCMITACELNEFLGPAEFAFGVMTNPLARDQLDMGSTNYCAAPLQAERTATAARVRQLRESHGVFEASMDDEEEGEHRALQPTSATLSPNGPAFMTGYHTTYSHPEAAAMCPMSYSMTADGSFHKQPDPEPISFAKFAQSRIDDPVTAPLSCQKLPLGEKILPIEEWSPHFFNHSSDLWSNLFSHELGPGCLLECRCLSHDYMTGMPVFNCTHMDYEHCPCRQHKQECHKAIIQEYLDKGGQHDPNEDSVDDPAGTYHMPSRRARKLMAAKRIFEKRVSDKNIRKLMPRHQKRVLKEIKLEKERRMRMRRRVRALSVEVEKHEKSERRMLKEGKASSEVAETRKLLETAKRQLTDYTMHIPDGFLGNYSSNATFDYDYCGSQPGDICQCDPIVDGAACIGTGPNAIAYPETYADAAMGGMAVPSDVAPPCPDFSNMRMEMEMAIDSDPMLLADTNKKAQMKMQLEAAYNYVDNYLDIGMLDGDLWRLYEELTMRTCMPMDMYSTIEHQMHTEYHPIDLGEVSTRCTPSIIRSISAR